MKHEVKPEFRVIINDDCDSHNRFDMEFFDLWAGAGVTTFSLCIGANQYWGYNPTVADSYRDMLIRAREESGLDDDRGEVDEGAPADWHRILVTEGKEPLAMAVEGCRKNGMAVFASLRMNDIHHGAYPGASTIIRQRQELLGSPWWHSHPELRAKGWDRRAWASLNFEFPEVRAYRLAVVREVAERFDIDGFDLDFMRMPPFFDRGRERECAHHLTSLVRETRKILDEEGAKRGKRIKLSASCMRNIQRCEDVGMDIRTWVTEGLVDILIPTWLKQDATDLPIEEFLELVQGTGIEICPSYGGGCCPRTPDAVRARALDCHQRGAHGLQLFNFFWLENPLDKGLYDQGVFSELADPAAMARKDKHYQFQDGLPIALTVGELPPHDYYYWLDVSLGQRLPPPVPGRKKSGRAEYRFHVADDIESARADGVLAEQRLTFTIVLATWMDEITFTLNGETVDAKGEYHSGAPLPTRRPLPPYVQYDIDLAAVKDVRNGWNTLGIDVRNLSDAFIPSDMYRGLGAVLFEAGLVLKYQK